MRRFFVCFLLLTGCTARLQVRDYTFIPPASSPVALPTHPWREMAVYVPQTDDAAAAWLKWFATYPNLRLVIAISPHFQHVVKDPNLKAQIQTLIKNGRLELALQIPNAPLLPLLLDDQVYGYSDDVVQLIAQSKAGFFKQWSFLPHGLVLPYGAASPRLISMLERLGFSWVVGALGAPVVDGPYESGSLMIWDAAPIGQSVGTVVRVWDERQLKGNPLNAWVMDVKGKTGTFLLPLDSGTAAVPLSARVSLKSRTWADPDLSLWAGQPNKDAAWSALRRTREALEKYKNSGQASVPRLDVAFEEIYSAQNSNYFASMGNTGISPALAEDREHEYQATLLAVYRIIGQPPPEDLFKSTAQGFPTSVRSSSTTAMAESFPDGREHVLIEDAIGDALMPGGPDLKSLDVWVTTDSVQWVVTLTTATSPRIYIYVDLNGQPNVGTPSLLGGLPFVTSPIDAWEYAIELSGQTATLYRTQNAGTYGIVQTFPIILEGNRFHVTMPREVMRGSPRRWGYQVIVMNGAAVSDFIDPMEISQKELWQDLSSGKRNDIPFVRIRSK